MKTSTSRFFGVITLLFLAAGAARAAPSAALLASEELAVIQAMAIILNREASRPYDFLYFETDFSASSIVASSMANPDRTQFCGLTRSQGQALVNELTAVNYSPVEFDKSMVKPTGLKLGHKKLERFRYLVLSRVVFGPGHQHAWLAVDLDGATGAILRVDKVAGEWTKTARCAGWVRAG
jgi:hypothetical protein